MKAIYILVGLCLFVAVYAAGFVDGKHTGDPYQKTIDSLTVVFDQRRESYNTLKDSLRQDTDQHNNNFNLVSEIKKAIRNEIKNQKQVIYSLPDSAVQSYVDSIRANGGFN